MWRLTFNGSRFAQSTRSPNASFESAFVREKGWLPGRDLNPTRRNSLSERRRRTSGNKYLAITRLDPLNLFTLVRASPQQSANLSACFGN